ncbi:MOSC domain-containing protein [Streptomyces tricolor]|nr:MOSC domain-containing protein [Streptomyces tricolor]
MKLLSVNLGHPSPVPYTSQPDGVTGIDKRPADGPVRVAAPGPKGSAGAGSPGTPCATRATTAGDDQAVYAYAREDLDEWERTLGSIAGQRLLRREPDDGRAGRLRGADRRALRIGSGVVLEVTSGRIPCKTFQGHLGESGWVRRFTQKGATGAYLRVIEPGEIQAGDPVEIVHRPDHGVTAAMQFRAVTTERELLPRLLAAGEALHAETLAKAREYVARHGA